MSNIYFPLGTKLPQPLCSPTEHGLTNFCYGSIAIELIQVVMLNYVAKVSLKNVAKVLFLLLKPFGCSSYLIQLCMIFSQLDLHHIFYHGNPFFHSEARSLYFFHVVIGMSSYHETFNFLLLPISNTNCWCSSYQYGSTNRWA